MPRRGTGRGRREAALDALAAVDSALHAELIALRSQNPQAYRRALQAWARQNGHFAPIRGLRVADEEPGTPGRARADAPHEVALTAIDEGTRVVAALSAAPERPLPVAQDPPPIAADPVAEVPAEAASPKKPRRKKPAAG